MAGMLKSWWSGGGEEKEQKEEEQEQSENWIGGLVRTVGGYAVTIGESVKTTVQSTSIVNEFQEEQHKFEREQRRQKDAALPPWVGYNEEEQMKAQILELSADSRNVLRNPPPGVHFHFEFAKSYPVAMATLREDPRLQKLRFELVPKKIKEDMFWRNYFYRVFLIKQSSQLATLVSAEAHSEEGGRVSGEGDMAASGDKQNKETKDQKLQIFQEDSTLQSPQETDFASDALVPSSEPISRESVRTELDQLGVPEKQADEWEAELQRELQDLGLEEGSDGGDGGEGGEGGEEWEAELQQMLETHTDTQ